ncbi:MAG: hypothetical protein SNG35_00170 [Rikenellaceae bacterium]
MGLKRRITLGFMGIVAILLIAGMVSFIELSMLGRETDKIFDSTRRNSDYASEMLKSLSSQNNAFIKMLAFDDNSYDTICYNSIDRLEEVLTSARRHSLQPEFIDSMVMNARQIRTLCSNFADARDSLNRLAEARRLVQLADSTHTTTPATVSVRDQRSTTIPIYNDYRVVYNNTMEMVSGYLTLSQDALAPDAQQLHHNAYRAVTPVMISLLVMIVVVLMLYYFTMIICVNPIISINKSLINFLNFKIPFAPKCYKRDEAEQLCENISALIKGSKKQ